MRPDEIDTGDGSVGYLSYRDFNRLEWAVHNGLKHIPWWRVCGNINSRDPSEGAKGKTPKKDAYPLPLPAPWLAAEEITRLLNELNRWPELSDAANDLDGEDYARLLTREVDAACARWPLDDRPHKVTFFRCLACDQQTLKYFPPRPGGRDDAVIVSPQVRIGPGHIREKAEVGQRPVLTDDRTRTIYVPTERPVNVGHRALMDTVVRCTNKACGAVLDAIMWDRAVAMIHAEQEAKIERARRLGTDQ